MKQFKIAYDGYGQGGEPYEAETIDKAMEQYIAQVCEVFPEAKNDFAAVNIVDGEVVSSYDDQPFQTGTVFLEEVNS